MSDEEIRVNWFDRLILMVAPKWGAARVRARLLARHFEAASMGHRTSGWHRRNSDANTAAAGAALSHIRGQARDLVRNNAWARRGLDRIETATVGWGIRPKASGRNADRVAEVWKRWAETTQCDAAGRLTLYGLQALIMRTVVESGEVLVRRRRRRPEDGLAIPLQLQVLEPDHIDTSLDGIKGPSGGDIIQGVEFDMIGRRVAYWLFDQHPGGRTFANPQSRRVAASEVLHVFRQDRAGQVRGVSWFAPISVRLRDFDEFEGATLVKQKIASCLAAFVTDLDGTGAPIGGGGTSASGQPLDSFEPGMILNLPAGKQVTVANPPASTDHQSFSATALRGVAAGLGVTFEDLTGDYCVAPETRVLRADLRWVRADELAVGTEIIAFDEEAPGGKGGRRKWRKASVVRAGRRNLHRRRIVTDGATVTVSDEHLFLCTSRAPTGAARGKGIQARSESPRGPGYGQRWVRADRLQPGDQIVFLCAPWGTGSTHTHGYLKGIADGEGWVGKGDAQIGIAQNPGPVLNEIGEALADLGITARLRQANGGHRVQQWSITGIAECLRFLGEVRPTRLLQHAERIYSGRMLAGGAKKNGWATAVTVLAVDDLGTGPVVTLETSTRTLVTEGLCSHNSHVNYSSARMARLAFNADVHHWRWNMLVPQFCDPAWGWMVEALALVGVETDAVALWTPPPAQMLDPDKEGQAAMRAIRSGQLTLDEMVREQGWDPDEHWAEYAEGLKRLDRLGIVLDSDPRKTTVGGQFQVAAPSETSPEDKKDSDKADENKPKAAPPKGDAMATGKASAGKAETKVFAYHQPVMKVKEIRENIDLPSVADDDLFYGEFLAKHGGKADGGKGEEADREYEEYSVVLGEMRNVIDIERKRTEDAEARARAALARADEERERAEARVKEVREGAAAELDAQYADFTRTLDAAVARERGERERERERYEDEIASLRAIAAAAAAPNPAPTTTGADPPGA